MSGNALQVRVLWVTHGHVTTSEQDCRGGGREAFVSLTVKVQIAASCGSRTVLTAVFWQGGAQGKGRTHKWNSIDVTCVLRAHFFKMVIYCFCSLKDNSVEDHHWHVKLFPLLGRNDCFINHYFSFLKCPLCLGLIGGLKKDIFLKVCNSLIKYPVRLWHKNNFLFGSWWFWFFLLCSTIFKARMISQKRACFSSSKIFL